MQQTHATPRLLNNTPQQIPMTTTLPTIAQNDPVGGVSYHPVPVHSIPSEARLYRVLWARDDKGTSGLHCSGYFTHKEACAILSKITKYPWRRDFLEEVTFLALVDKHLSQTYCNTSGEYLPE